MSARIRDGGAGVGAGGGAGATVMLQALVALPAAESAALAEKSVVPRAVGVPLTAPVAAVRLNPAGSEPVVEYV
jgi:hypothetical protein